MNGARKSIKWKILAGVLLLEASLTFAFVLTLTRSAQHHIRESSTNGVAGIQELYNSLVDGDEKMLSSILDTFATNETSKDLFAKRDRQGLLAYSQPLFNAVRERYGITHLVYIDNDGTAFLRMHKPDLFGDVLNQATVIAARNSDKLTAGIDQGQVGFALRVVSPLYYKGQRVGFLEFGEEMGKFKDIAKKETGSDVFLLVDKKFLAEKDYHTSRKNLGQRDDWDDLASYVLVGETLGDKPYFMNSVFTPDVASIQGAQFLRTAQRAGDRTYAIGAFPLLGSSKNAIGVVMTFSDVTKMADANKWSLIYVALTSAVIMALSFVAATWFLGIAIIKPLTNLSERADQISLGELGEALKSDREDEIGMITKSFERMRVSLEKSMARLGM